MNIIDSWLKKYGDPKVAKEVKLKLAEDFYRSKMIDSKASENAKKFISLVDFSQQAEIMEEYANKKIQNQFLFGLGIGLFIAAILMLFV